ncbi:transcriptional regulator ATRX-like isoform X2 [Hydractinia symbiolongicarpus]|nr:transcriptional regulator ATRX-like isoform X2 [Hydractinia symbiolongicarpus]
MIPEHVHCTACNKKLSTKKKKICKHPKLSVLLCKKCLKFINSNEFTRDEMGVEEYCTWCGDGGNLVCCDFCEKAYCKHCVKRNLGKEFLKALLEADDDVKWKCFSCDHVQIKNFIEECDAVMKYIKLQKLNEPAFDGKKTHFAGPTQMERQKRLTEVARQVKDSPEVHVKLKSSFPKYETIDDDDDDDHVDRTVTNTNNKKIDSTDNETFIDTSKFMSNATNMSNTVNTTKSKGNDNIKNETNASNVNNVNTVNLNIINTPQKEKRIINADEVRPVVNKLDPSTVSDIITKIRDSNKKDDSGRTLRGKKLATYNEKELQQKVEEEAEKKNKEIETKQKGHKKKQTVIMLSSDDESDSSDEIVVVSKSGKRSTIRKSILLAAQAALEGTEKKAKKVTKKKRDKKRKKGLGSFMRLSFSHSKAKSSSSSSDRTSEDSSDDEDKKSTDEGKIIDKENKEKTKMETVEDIAKLNTEPATNNIGPASLTETKDAQEKEASQKSYNVVVDDQQPGPSGVRPKNKMQRRRQVIDRKSSTDSDSDDVAVNQLSRKRRSRANSKSIYFENSVTKNRRSTRGKINIDDEQKESVDQSATTIENMEKNVNKDNVKDNEKNYKLPTEDKKTEEEKISKGKKEDSLEKIKTDSPAPVQEELSDGEISDSMLNDDETESEEDEELTKTDVNKNKENTGVTNSESMLIENENQGHDIKDPMDVNKDKNTKLEGSKKGAEANTINGGEIAMETTALVDGNSDSDKEVQTKTSSKKKTNKPETVASSSSDDNEDKVQIKSSNKKKKPKPETVASSVSDGDNDEEIQIKSSSKKNISVSDGNNDEEEQVKCSSKKNKLKSETVASSASSASDGYNDEDLQIKSSSKKNKCKPETVASSASDDENNEEVQVKSKEQKKRKCEFSSNSGSESEVEIKPCSKSRVKKRKKRVRLNSVSSSNDSSGNDVNMTEKVSSDSSSSDGSVIITRRSKRQKNAAKKKKTPKQRGKKNKEAVVLSDSDDELQSPSKKGRRKIRRILKDHELNEETIHARELEEQRRKRLLERTKADRQGVNHILQEEEGDFVLERNKKKEVLVSVDPEINKHLKPHQRKGIQFVYDCVIETVNSYKKGEDGSGCLLAHCMGLGKTLQVVTILHTLKTNENIKMSKFLVVAPLNTVLNWEQEFEKWLNVDQRLDVYVLSYCNDNKDRVHTLRRWFNKGGVVITGYEMYRNLVNGTFIRSKKMKEEIKKFLLDPGPEVVVCDEGHVLRNNTSAISKAMNSIKTKRRIVLTGTPLQNNLPEYHVMVDFVKPKLVGTRKEFQNRFVNPIHNGQCSNSTPRDVKVMKQRSHVLYQLLSGCVQRQDYSVLSPFLPPKREYTIFVRLTEKQIKMYQYYIENFVYKDATDKLKGSSLFSDFQCLSRIWTHPWSLQIERQRQAYRNRFKEEDSMDEFIDDNNAEESESSNSDNDKEKPWTVDTSSDEEDEAKRRKRRRVATSGSDSSSDEETDEEPESATPKRTTRNSRRITEKDVKKKENEGSDTSTNDMTVVKPVDIKPSPSHGSLRSGINFKDATLNPEREDEKPEFEKEWYDEFITEDDECNVELSGKLVLMMEILANADVVGDKVLVFSQSLASLDLIESCLGGGEIGGNQLNWCHGVDYFRMDGSTPVHKRKRWADIFNDPENEKCRLFLISTKAGSLGINMVAANRVIIFDCSWNPSHDVQSVFRVYRFGQEKPVYVYRLISQGTMEEKVYGRQITKLAVAGRVVDEMQIERHFTDEEIRELYTFAPEKVKEDGETPQLPKDPLLAEVLQRQHPKYIVRYHEHDLLLENVEAEELTEEERKQAWKSYEDEKENAKALYTRPQNFDQLYAGQVSDVNNRMQYFVNGNQLYRVHAANAAGPVQLGKINLPNISHQLPPDVQARMHAQRSNEALMLAEQARANQIARFAINYPTSGSRVTVPVSGSIRGIRVPAVYSLAHGGPITVLRPGSAQIPLQIQNRSTAVRLPPLSNAQKIYVNNSPVDRPFIRVPFPTSTTNKTLLELAEGQKRGRPSKYDVNWQKQ